MFIALSILAVWAIPGIYLGLKYSRKWYGKEYADHLESKAKHDLAARGHYQYCLTYSSCVSPKPSKAKASLLALYRGACWPIFLAISGIVGASHKLGVLTYGDIVAQVEEAQEAKTLLAQIQHVEKFRSELESIAFDARALTDEYEQLKHDRAVKDLARSMTRAGSPLSEDYVRNMLTPYLFNSESRFII